MGNDSRFPALQYFAGGPLAPSVGNALVDAGVKLSCVYGATEAGVVTYIFRNEVDQKLWDWVRFSQYSKIRWVPQDDSTYECQIIVCLEPYTAYQC
jgi:hypothetical protein